MSEQKYKICFYSMDGIGHIAACVGVMQPLIARGHDVFFIANEEHKGKFLPFGAREHIIVADLTPEEREAKASAAKDAGMKLLKSGLLSSKSSYEKVLIMKDTGFLEMVSDMVQDQDSKYEEILQKEKPDLIVIDHFVIPPSFIRAQIPWVLIHSPSPLFVYNDPRIPPAFSGYSIKNKDEKKWKEFVELSEKYFFGYIREIQRKIFKNANIDFPKYDTNIIMSPYLNIIAYPKELDYSSIVELPENVFRIDAFSRDLPETNKNKFQIPDDFLNRKEGIGLIYLSMGSMGGADVELMKNLVKYASESRHKFIIVKGPHGDDYEVNFPNIIADNFLPQTAILPKCDLVITHGGNNSTTETFFAGKPMIVMPLFADQYDNATRVTECGFGVSFNPYTVTKEELFEAIDKLLFDDNIKKKLDAASKRMKSENLKECLATKLEQIAKKK